MAAGGCARRVLLGSSSPARLLSSGARSQAPISSPASCARSFSSRKIAPRISRMPIELGSFQSLMPFHSATASALLTSMLSGENGKWCWLSEGFATPL